MSDNVIPFPRRDASTLHWWCSTCGRERPATHPDKCPCGNWVWQSWPLTQAPPKLTT